MDAKKFYEDVHGDKPFLSKDAIISMMQAFAILVEMEAINFHSEQIIKHQKQIFSALGLSK